MPFDPAYAARLGVDINSLYIFPTGYRRTGSRDHRPCTSGAIDIVVIDSVACLVRRAEIEGETWETPAWHAGPLNVSGSPQIIWSH